MMANIYRRMLDNERALKLGLIDEAEYLRRERELADREVQLERFDDGRYDR